MSNFLIVESRRNNVIIIFLNLCTLYCRIDSFLLMLIARKLSEEEKEFMIAKCLSRRRFFEVDLEVCRYHVSAWFFWLLMSRSVCRLWKEDRRADDWMLSLRARRWRMILLSDWWRDRTNKRFDLLTNFTTCAFEEFLQNDRSLKEKILVKERWDRVDERLRQKCVEDVENDCCCRMIIRKRYISWKSLMRCVELDLEDWNEDKKENINKIVSAFKLRDDVRFKRTLIRNVEIRDADDINERIEIEMIWLKKNVFVYKQRAFRFEMFRLENQKNQKFDWFLVNFRFFDSDCLDSNNLSTLCRFDDSFVQSALKVREYEIFAWEHDDQLAFEFRDWWDELRDDDE
jgi:hypothetical protein